MRKRCSKCKKTKPVEKFSKDRSQKSGLFAWCKLCSSAHKKAFNEANPGRYSAYAKEYLKRPENVERRRRRERDAYWKDPEANNAANKAWRLANPEAYQKAHRRASLKARYGLTVEAWEALFAAQQGRCACCKQPFKTRRGTHTEHNHARKKVRGITCTSCNHRLAVLDDPAWLALGIAYLKRAEDLSEALAALLT